MRQKRQVVKSGFKSKVEMIDRLLCYLGLSDQEGALNLAYDSEFRVDGDLKVPLYHFAFCEPVMAMDNNGLLTSHDRLFLNPQGSEIDELWRVPQGLWRSCWLGPGEEYVAEYAGKKCLNVYNIQLVRKVDLKEVRGWPLKSFDVYEYALACLFADGTYRATSYIIEKRGREFWEIGFGPYAHQKPLLFRDDSEADRDIVSKIHWAKSIALTNYYEWFVDIGWADSGMFAPPVRLNCDPVGARSAFKMRDAAPGKSRRDALLHWVSEHWRAAKASIDPEVHIWPYLRGAESFTFSGLKCVISPSVYDLKKAEEYQKRALAEKSFRSLSGKKTRKQ